MAARLRRAKVEIHPAKNILRAARLTSLPRTNAKVKTDLGKIVSAAWHRDERADVACVLVDRPR